MAIGKAAAGKVKTAIPSAALATERLPLPENSPFKFWIDPRECVFIAGECRYNPVAVPIRPGLHNTPSDGSASQIDALQRDKLGRVEVPLDFEVIAWGAKCAGYMVELEIGADQHGKTLLHYHDVWRRYQKLGSGYVPEFDRDGWNDFCARVEKLMGGPPHPAIQAAERSRREALIAQHHRLAHVSPGSLANIAMLEASLKGPEKARKTA